MTNNAYQIVYASFAGTSNLNAKHKQVKMCVLVLAPTIGRYLWMWLVQESTITVLTHTHSRIHAHSSIHSFTRMHRAISQTWEKSSINNKQRINAFNLATFIEVTWRWCSQLRFNFRDEMFCGLRHGTYVQFHTLLFLVFSVIRFGEKNDKTREKD